MADGGNEPIDVALRALGEALDAADGPPASAVAQAKALFTWRTIDAELAELTFDSLLDGELAGVRSGGGGARTLTFETAAVVVDAELTGDADRFDVVGSVSPVEDSALAIQRPGAEEVAVEVDALGRFQLRGLEAGVLRFVVRLGGGARVVTDWFTL